MNGRYVEMRVPKPAQEGSHPLEVIPVMAWVALRPLEIGEGHYEAQSVFIVGRIQFADSWLPTCSMIADVGWHEPEVDLDGVPQADPLYVVYVPH